MWNRREIKTIGKARFRASYWKSVLAALIIAAAGGGAAIGGSYSGISGRYSINDLRERANSFSESDYRTFFMLIIVFAIIFLIVFCISSLTRIFALNPLFVGAKTYYLENSNERTSLGNLGYGFRNYGRAVNTMFFRDLFLWLWSLLFIVPGIIKSYSYRMVPYIIADNPEMSGTEVITKSRQMMNGHKWRTFVLDLSFLPWQLLSAITCGIVGALYVNPYREATDAELYQRIKAQAM